MNIITEDFLDGELLDQWTLQRRCIRCSAFYVEKENVGQWKCSQHSGLYNPEIVGQVLNCCGKKYRGLQNMVGCVPWGCVKADHTMMKIPYNSDHDILISRTMMSQMTPSKAETAKGLKNVGQESYVNVSRFDWKMDDRIRAHRTFGFVDGISSTAK